jgi:anti-sigma B factor antagonist
VNGGAEARVWLEREAPVAVAELEGEVDASNAEEVGGEIAGLISNTPTGLLLDLSRTRYLDSAGVRMLLDLAEKLRRRRQDLSLVVPERTPVRRLLTVAGIHQLMPVVESREEILDRADGEPG